MPIDIINRAFWASFFVMLFGAPLTYSALWKLPPGCSWVYDLTDGGRLKLVHAIDSPLVEDADGEMQLAPHLWKPDPDESRKELPDIFDFSRYSLPQPGPLSAGMPRERDHGGNDAVGNPSR